MSSSLTTSYDSSNVFARIIRGEIPAKKIYETQHTLVIEDISPQAPTHMLVFPKGQYTCFAHFIAHGTQEEIIDLFTTVKDIAKRMGLDQNGYRLISNKGNDGGQEVPHFHVHLLGGRKLGSLVGPAPKNGE